MKTATDVGLQTWEADVTCGVWCQGGSVRWLKTDHPQYTDASDVWVRGDDAIAALESLRAELADLQDGYSRLSRDFALAIESDSKHIAELAECREDAERWRYLRDDGCGFEITVREENEDGYESWVSGYPGAELDAAIDAARKGEGE